MKVKGLVWLGIPADDYAGAVRFFTETLGLDVAFDEAGTMELSAGNDDRIQVFGPGHRSFGFYRDHGASIVPLFEVDNLDEARAVLARSGVEVFGEPESDGVWAWLTFGRPMGTSTVWVLAPGSQRVREGLCDLMAPHDHLQIHHDRTLHIACAGLPAVLCRCHVSRCSAHGVSRARPCILGRTALRWRRGCGARMRRTSC
jgi:predicted enzyme related to lactoylglutathione lyase